MTFVAIATKSFICELITRFPTSHLMNVMGIVIYKFGFKVMLRRISTSLLIKVHYCSKKLLELVKTSKVNLPFVVNKIYLAVLFPSALNM